MTTNQRMPGEKVFVLCVFLFIALLGLGGVAVEINAQRARAHKYQELNNKIQELQEELDATRDRPTGEELLEQLRKDGGLWLPDDPQERERRIKALKDAMAHERSA